MKNKLVNILIFISITIFLIACTAESTDKPCKTSDDCRNKLKAACEVSE